MRSLSENESSELFEVDAPAIEDSPKRAAKEEVYILFFVIIKYNKPTKKKVKAR